MRVKPPSFQEESKQNIRNYSLSQGVLTMGNFRYLESPFRHLSGLPWSLYGKKVPELSNWITSKNLQKPESKHQENFVVQIGGSAYSQMLVEFYGSLLRRANIFGSSFLSPEMHIQIWVTWKIFGMCVSFGELFQVNVNKVNKSKMSQSGIFRIKQFQLSMEIKFWNLLLFF